MALSSAQWLIEVQFLTSEIFYHYTTFQHAKHVAIGSNRKFLINLNNITYKSVTVTIEYAYEGSFQNTKNIYNGLKAVDPMEQFKICSAWVEAIFSVTWILSRVHTLPARALAKYFYSCDYQVITINIFFRLLHLSK